MTTKSKKKETEVEPLVFDSYLTVIKNAVGTKIFRDFYAEVNGKRRDITRGGVRSCAFFVSTVLTIFGLIKEVHMTLGRTVEDMEESGWYKIKKPRVGAVLVWEREKFGREEFGHIGFYIGNGKAISNSASFRVPKKHYWTYAGKRKVEAIWWHKKLNR